MLQHPAWVKVSARRLALAALPSLSRGGWGRTGWRRLGGWAHTPPWLRVFEPGQLLGPFPVVTARGDPSLSPGPQSQLSRPCPLQVGRARLAASAVGPLLSVLFSARLTSQARTWGQLRPRALVSQRRCACASVAVRVSPCFPVLTLVLASSRLPGARPGARAPPGGPAFGILPSLHPGSGSALGKPVLSKRWPRGLSGVCACEGGGPSLSRGGRPPSAAGTAALLQPPSFSLLPPLPWEPCSPSVGVWRGGLAPPSLRCSVLAFLPSPHSVLLCSFLMGVPRIPTDCGAGPGPGPSHPEQSELAVVLRFAGSWAL